MDCRPPWLTTYSAQVPLLPFRQGFAMRDQRVANGTGASGIAPGFIRFIGHGHFAERLLREIVERHAGARGAVAALIHKLGGDQVFAIRREFQIFGTSVFRKALRYRRGRRTSRAVVQVVGVAAVPRRRQLARAQRKERVVCWYGIA